MSEFSVIVLLLSCLPTIALICYFILRNSYDILEPLTFAALPFAAFPLINALYLLAYDGHLHPAVVPDPYSLLSTHYFVAGLSYAVGFTMFLLGYSSRIRIREPQLMRSIFRREWSVKRLRFVIFILIALCSVGVYLFVTSLSIHQWSLDIISAKRFFEVEETTGFKTAASGYSRWLANLGQTAYLFTLVYLLVSRRSLGIKHWLVLASLFILALSFPLFVSRRGVILNLVIMTVAAWHYTQKTIKIRQAVAVGLLSLTLLTMMGNLREGPVGDRSLIRMFNPGDIVEAIGSRPGSGYWLLASIMKRMPEAWEYQNGVTLASWMYAPIPRQVWPEKPIVSLGQLVKTQLFFGPYGGGGGKPPSSIGEFYINFGYAGILISFAWLFVGGVASKAVYNTFRPHLGTNKNALVIYLVVLTYIIPSIFVNPFASVLMKFALLFAPILLILSVVSTARRHRRT